LNTADHVDALAGRRGDRVAVVDAASALTWADLARRSIRLAIALARRGLPRDAVVYEQLPGCVDLIVLRLACERAGLRLVMAPVALREAEVARLVELTRPALAVVPGTPRPLDHAAILRRGTGGPRPVLTPARWSSGTDDTLEALEAEAPADDPAVLAGRGYGPGEYSKLATTSGTTGAPKLVGVRIGPRLDTARQQMARWGMGEDDVVLALSAPKTGTADGVGYSGASQTGFRLVLTEQFDPDRACAAIIRHGVTIVIGVPTMAAMMLRALDGRRHGGIRPGQVRLFVSHGAPLSRQTARALEAGLGCRVVQAFGAADYGSMCATSAGDPEDVRHGTVGRPLDGVDVVVRDDDGRPVAAGMPGRLHVRGGEAATGYLDSLEAPAAQPDGYRDLMERGSRDLAGNVTLLGRTRDLIIRGGQNIVPAEVEAALAGHPGVSEAAVVGVPHPLLGEIVCAGIVRRPGSSAGMADLLAFLHARGMARYKLPARIEFLEALPTLAAGTKVDKRRLRDLFVARAAGERGEAG
jgi:non-ribosomal peptide synthetase component E (peptide arylation enzyme)